MEKMNMDRKTLKYFARMAAESYVNDPVHAYATKSEEKRKKYFVHQDELDEHVRTKEKERQDRLKFTINGWTDEELGNIPPSIFIPIAEETGLIIPIGRWILRTAVKTLKAWQEKYQFDGVMSVNISPIQLLQDNFIEELDEIVRKLTRLFWKLK